MTDDPETGYPKGRRKRAEIVSAALEAFGTTGYRSASMTRIAAACHVTRAGLAHHFPTKESLLTAVLAERDRVNGELFFAGCIPAADGLDYFDRLVRVIEHNSEHPAIVALYANLSTEAADPAHPAHEYFMRRYEQLRADVRAALDELRERRLVRDDVDLAGAEVDVIALLDGLQVQWLLQPGAVDMASRLRAWLGRILRPDASGIGGSSA